MAPSARSNTANPLLPPAVAAFLRARLIDGAALFVALAGIVLALGLGSFHPLDPSLNTSGEPGPVQNLLGIYGATIADVLIQTLGLSAGLFPLYLWCWAWRIGSRQGLPRFHIRLLWVALSLIACSAALFTVPHPASWPLEVGLGGFFGEYVIGKYGLVLIQDLGLRIDPQYWGIVLFPLALAAVVMAMGLSRQDWKAMGRAISNLSRRTAGLIGNGGHAVISRSSHALEAKIRDRARRKAVEEDRKDQNDPIIHAGDRLVDDEDDDIPFDVDEDVSIDPAARLADKGPVGKIRDDAEKSAAPVKVKKAPAKIKKSKKALADAEPEFSFEDGYQLPPLALLSEAPAGSQSAAHDAMLEENARQLEEVLADYGVKGEITAVHPGPVVTLYELEPAPGTKSSRVIGLSDDIARSMSALSVRAAVVPGRSVIGIEIPNDHRETVYLREILSSDAFDKAKGALNVVLGKDIGGNPIITDLAKTPHLLVAGTTGSGKSVGVNAMIVSLLYRMRPEDLRLIMVDPKMLELSVYEGIPHLLTPVVTEAGKAVVALKWAVREMENRYRKMSQLGVRNIAGYNARVAEAEKKGEQLTRRVQTGFDPETREPIYEEEVLDLEHLPYIVIVIDEFSDLMMVAGKDVEFCVLRLAQMARAAGLHLILATQRPSVDVITGTIKSNLPSRISFQVSSKVDSRTILGQQGAEQLLGMGDMLHMAGGGRIQRVHGPFVADEEVEAVIDHLKNQGEPDYVHEVTEMTDDEDGAWGEGGSSGPGQSSGDDLYDQAIAVVLKHKKVSTSFVQRQLRVGYNKAANLIERMEEEGLISPPNHAGKREILMRDGGEEIR